MRRRTVITLASSALVLVALPWVLTRAGPRGFSPRATLTLLGYERTNRTSYTELLPKEDEDYPGRSSLRFSTSPPNQEVHVQTNTGVLLARVKLANTGTQPIAFYRLVVSAR